MEKNKPLIKLLIVDDHQLIRDGIRVMLELQNKTFSFNITEAENGEDAIKKILHHSYDVVLIDYQLPKMSGAETIEKMMLYRPKTKILALSNYDELTYVNNMLNAGAKGYILKNVEPAELLTAIKTILNDKPYYSNEVAVKLIENEKTKYNTKNHSHHSNKFGLTKSELVILKMIALEMTNTEIANNLHLAKATIDSHRQNLLHKLGAKNTVGLVKAAYLLKLIS
jgi:DNA-binding NarL/FixJ family response regulator